MRVPECLTTVGVAAFSCTVFMLPPFLLSQTVAYAAAAVAGTANATEAAIAQLEDKLYEHKYPNETDDARLSRIEKFVFGAAQTGTVAERLQRLQNSITSQANAIDKPPAVNAQSSSSSSQSTAGQSSSASASAPSDAVTVSSTFDSANYPRVTELEKDMLNATYVHEPLAQRLSRLEAKAFGAPSKSNDLCERVGRSYCEVITFLFRYLFCILASCTSLEHQYKQLYRLDSTHSSRIEDNQVCHHIRYHQQIALPIIVCRFRGIDSLQHSRTCYRCRGRLSRK